MTKLTLEDLEAMRRHYGIAQEEEDLQEDLGQVGALGEVGIGLERWAWLRGLQMEYALDLREYLDQEGRKRRTEEGRSSSPNDLFARLPTAAVKSIYPDEIVEYVRAVSS